MRRWLPLPLALLLLALGSLPPAPLSWPAAAGGRAAPLAPRPSPAVTPNDPYLPQQWHLAHIHMPEAWAVSTGSGATVLAVVDSGVAFDHEDLRDKLLPGVNLVDPSQPPADDSGHGTFAAGVAAAAGNNALGVSGVDWGARILPVKVLDAAGASTFARAAAGIRWAVDNGARVVLVGFVSPAPSPELDEAVTYAWRRGALVVAPVGDDGLDAPTYPAASPFVVGVGGTDRADAVLPTSNRGPGVALVAPAVEIVGPHTAAPYVASRGTIAAAAQVAGLATLIWATSPALSNVDVAGLLLRTADDLGAPGRDDEAGWGRLNAARALGALQASTPAFPARFAAPRPMAGSYNAPTPSPRLFLPLVMSANAGWATVLHLQNPNPIAADLAITFYDRAGAVAATHPLRLNAFGSRALDPAEVPALPAGFVGAAVVEATAPVAAVVNQIHPDWDLLSYRGFAGGAATVRAPLILKDYFGWATAMQVQNLADQPATVTVTYRGENLAGSWQESAVLPPFSAATFDQAPLPPGALASAVVQSDAGQPLAVVVNERKLATLQATAYEGIAAGAPRLSVPLVFRQYAGWSTGVQAQNLGDAPTAVRLTLQSNRGGYVQEAAAIAPGGTATFNQAEAAGLPDDLLGSGVLEAAGGADLAAVVNEVRQGAPMAMTYAASAEAATVLSLPSLMRNAAGWHSGFVVYNPGEAEARLRADFYRADGVLMVTRVDTVPPHTSRTYDQAREAALPDGWYGSVVITVLSGPPVVAIANQLR